MVIKEIINTIHTLCTAEEDCSLCAFKNEHVDCFTRPHEDKMAIKEIEKVIKAITTKKKNSN